MPEPVKMAFERQVVVLPLSNILPIKRVPDIIKQAMRYKRIVASIAEVGIVEPLVVARPRRETGPYMLVDGHLRYAALVDLDKSETPCLIADDDEAFAGCAVDVEVVEHAVAAKRLSQPAHGDLRRPGGGHRADLLIGQTTPV